MSSDAVDFCKRVEKAAKDRAPLELFGVSYEAVGDEPFCETVYRWLHGDAPMECAECPDGKYGELTATLGRGTCKDAWGYDPFAAFRCSECGARHTASNKRVIRFCYNCGRKVVDE